MAAPALAAPPAALWEAAFFLLFFFLIITSFFIIIISFFLLFFGGGAAGEGPSEGSRGTPGSGPAPPPALRALRFPRERAAPGPARAAGQPRLPPPPVGFRSEVLFRRR